MKHRLYHPPPLESGQTLTLERDRAHYLTRVLRLRRGAEIECFDGIGHAWRARIEDGGGHSSALTLVERLADEPAPEPALHLVQGLLKGAAMDQVVQKATELGATDLWPVLAERSNVPDAAERLARRRQHWQRVIESAAEQCGALHLPRLHEVRTVAAFFDAPPQAQLILLDPGADALPLTLPRAALGVLVGPEGGWSEPERQAALANGARRHGLGTLVLRGETAPLAVLAAVRHGWGWA
ncbi:MAG: 16S rRNA (uracil(1498)-N(3))-methyltransferase [Pseudomonadales bacterium]